MEGSAQRPPAPVHWGGGGGGSCWRKGREGPGLVSAVIFHLGEPEFLWGTGAAALFMDRETGLWVKVTSPQQPRDGAGSSRQVPAGQGRALSAEAPGIWAGKSLTPPSLPFQNSGAGGVPGGKGPRKGGEGSRWGILHGRLGQSTGHLVMQSGGGRGPHLRPLCPEVPCPPSASG